MREQSHLEKQLFVIGCVLFWLLVGIAAVLKLGWLDRLPQIPCMFVLVFGMYCPGCGGTRAAKALLEGRLLTSFFYHPVVLYGAVLYLCFMLTNGLSLIGVKGVRPLKFRNGYLWAGLVLIAVNFVVKNVLLFVFGISMK